MAKLVKMVKLNNLQYNPNRDPQVYRRCVGEPFRIQALLEGEGLARVTLSARDGSRLGEAKVGLPGTFVQELRFPAAGTRVVTLSAEGDGQTFSQELRLDVLEHEMQE
jgi:hypothetical protein